MNINWITLNVMDLEKSKEFYTNYLGMNVENEFSPSETKDILFLKANNGIQVELIYDKKADSDPMNDNGVSLGISSTEYDKLLSQAKEREIIVIEPMTMGNIECFFVHDPNGFRIQIIK